MSAVQQLLLQAVLNVVVWYSGPGQHNHHNNNLELESEDDNQALLNLERNIANIERSMSASQLGKTDLSSILNRQVLKRMMMIKLR